MPAELLLACAIALVLLPLLVVILNYNGLVRTRNHIQDSWAGIDTELKRRYDLVPNLVETVKGYASHERKVLERVVAARSRATMSRGTPGQQAADENMLIAALGQMFALAEGYPQLRSDRSFLSLQEELVNTEDRIQATRRFYNGNVREYNNRCQMFPSSLIAGMFGFRPAEYFEIDDLRQRAPIQVDFDRHLGAAGDADP